MYKMDIYKVIDDTDNWPRIATVYGETEQDCIDNAEYTYGSNEAYHWTNPVEDNNSEAARSLGSSRTPAKTAAARTNGAKGGRPRKDARIFKGQEIGKPGRWVADLSPNNVVNPDYYWYFGTRHEAAKFLALVDGGERPEEAAYNAQDKAPDY